MRARAGMTPACLVPHWHNSDRTGEWRSAARRLRQESRRLTRALLHGRGMATAAQLLTLMFQQGLHDFHEMSIPGLSDELILLEVSCLCAIVYAIVYAVVYAIVLVIVCAIV